MSGHPEQISMAGGLAASTKVPGFQFIPSQALIAIANRFELGIERKGEKAWNALSPNQTCLKDESFVLERIAHVINHALKLRDKINAGNGEAILNDDDAGAIAWGGVFLICAVEALLQKWTEEQA